MSRTLRSSVVLAAASVVALGLVAAGAGSAVSAPRSHAAHAGTPQIKVTISKKGFVVAGPKTFQAGRVAISLAAHGIGGEFQVAQFKKGYTFKDLRADITGFGETLGQAGTATPAGMKHLRHAIHHTTLLGGLDAEPGQTLHGTVMLAHPGK